MTDSSCPFCVPDTPALVNARAFAIYDRFPVTQGHILIVPRRHIRSFFEADDEERQALFELLAQARDLLIRCFRPDGFNIGINDGAAAGQTVMHLHIHLIPRYERDTEDPRGGVRWIMPEKAPYWKREAADQPGEHGGGTT